MPKPLTKFLLSASIDTDDDAVLLFNGEKSTYLQIEEVFDTKQEAIDHLSTIKVLPNSKASRILTEWLSQSVQELKTKDSFSIHGNQTIEIFLTPVVPSKTIPPMPDILPRYEDEHGYLESILDWTRNNQEAVEWFSENHDAIRTLITKKQNHVKTMSKLSDVFKIPYDTFELQ